MPSFAAASGIGGYAAPKLARPERSASQRNSRTPIGLPKTNATKIATVPGAERFQAVRRQRCPRVLVVREPEHLLAHLGR